jgi:AraC family transcriptional regulator
MEIEVRKLPSLRLACVRHVGPYYQIGAAFKQLHTWAAEHGLGETTLVGVYYDDPRATPEAELQSDAALILPEGRDFSSDRGVAIRELPGGTYAVARVVGPYSELPHAWNEFWREAAQAGYRERSAPPLELYGPMEGVPPQELVTELCIPIEAAEKR